MYSATPATAREQRELDAELQLLGIQCDLMEDAPIEFWDEHRGALEWWFQVQDLMRYQGRICEGLDVLAVQADMTLSGRSQTPLDYQKLRLIAHTVTQIFNEQLSS